MNDSSTYDSIRKSVDKEYLNVGTVLDLYYDFILSSSETKCLFLTLRVYPPNKVPVYELFTVSVLSLDPVDWSFGKKKECIVSYLLCKVIFLSSNYDLSYDT